MPMKMPLAMPLCLLAGALAAPTHAQTLPAPVPVPEKTLLTVTARGEVEETPDIAVVSAGVVTQAQSANAALSENRARMNRVIAALRKAGIDRADVQTSNLSLNPDYRYEERQPPVITSYRAQNMVTVTVRDISEAGTVLDALVAEGANQINGPNFQIEDQEAALDSARRDAMTNARARAELYAGAAGMSVARIVSISESGGYGPAPPVAVRMRAEAMDAASPVEPGRLTLGTSVTVIYELD